MPSPSEVVQERRLAVAERVRRSQQAAECVEVRERAQVGRKAMRSAVLAEAGSQGNLAVYV